MATRCSRVLHIVPLLAVVIVPSVLAGSRDDTLDPLFAFEFVPHEVVQLEFGAVGAAVTLSGRAPKACSSPIVFEAAQSVGRFALVLTDEGQGCFSGAEYSNGDFSVRSGTVTGGNFTFEAFEVSPPQSSATKFVASGQEIYVKATSGGDFVIFTLIDGVAVKVAQKSVPQGAENSFLATGVKVHGLSQTSAYFVASASQALPSTTRHFIKAAAATECQDAVAHAAIVGDLAVVTTRKQNNCWTDGRYNNDEVLVEHGTLKRSDGSERVAYRISPPRVRAKEFVTSKLSLRMRSSTASSISAQWLDLSARGTDPGATEPLQLPGDGTFVPLGQDADDLAGPIVFVPAAAGERITWWPPVSSSVHGAWMAGGASEGGHSLTARRFTLSTTPASVLRPFDPTVDWQHGPGEHAGNYGIPTQFFRVHRRDGREGIVWQDVTSHDVYMSWLAVDLDASVTKRVLQGRAWLLAVASNRVDELVLLTVGEEAPAAKTASNTVTLVKVASHTGETLLSASLDTSASGLDVHAFSSPGASMVWNTNRSRLGLILARTMTQGSDGLNHQGAIGVVIDAATLKVSKNWGQTSGHSFGNTLLLDSFGDFLGMDLGDNFPRGVHVHHFSEAKMQSRLVYTFKTQHGTTAKSPAGQTYEVYKVVGDKTFYKWSNDNYVYTELAHTGIVEVDDGLLIFFAGENPPLDDSKVGSAMNLPRNAACVKIPKDLASTNVSSAGSVETGGYFAFNGDWYSQENKGISFLTDYASMTESVSRLKTARVAVDRTVLLWERWSKDEFQDSQWMVVKDDCSRVAGPVTLGIGLRLPIQDSVFVEGGRVVAYSGSSDGKILRLELCIDDACRTSSPTPTSDGVPTSGGAPTTGGGSGGTTDTSVAVSATLAHAFSRLLTFFIGLAML